MGGTDAVPKRRTYSHYSIQKQNKTASTFNERIGFVGFLLGTRNAIFCWHLPVASSLQTTNAHFERYSKVNNHRHLWWRWVPKASLVRHINKNLCVVSTSTNQNIASQSSMYLYNINIYSEKKSLWINNVYGAWPGICRTIGCRHQMPTTLCPNLGQLFLGVLPSS